MTQRSFFRSLILTALFGLTMAVTGTPALAQDAAKAKAETAAAAKPTVAPEEAIATADSIAAFDASLVKGHALPWQIYYQKAASPVMEHLEWLHDFVMVIITIITIAVLVLLTYVCLRFRASKNPKPHRFAHNTLVEVVWTIVPIIILVAIGIPSVRAHFQYTNNQNIIDNPDVTIKVTGNQWYWTYEYPDDGLKFDSNIVKDEDLKKDEPRLLMVDNPVVVPVNKVVRIQLTASDVIHNWAMPAFGVKQDAIPGKLNETWFKATEEGIYFGQCSELCGKFHGYMPIMVKVVSDEDYQRWIDGAKLKFAFADHIQLALNQ